MAKVSVGLVQAWMIFELAMKFRSAVNVKCLNFFKCVFMVLVMLLFCAATITICVVLVSHSNTSIRTDDIEITSRLATV